jgi:hypothetical protein
VGLGPADHLVISQFQLVGNGGEFDEFIELYNPTAAPISLTGTSLQYRDAWGLVTAYALPAATMQPHHWFLVAATGYMNSTTPDVVQSSFQVMSYPTFPGGTLYLVNGTSALPNSPSCPMTSSVIDRVGWGNAAFTCPEGIQAQPPSTNASTTRKLDGACGNAVDSDDNHDDFYSPNNEHPRNSATPPVP